MSDYDKFLDYLAFKHKTWLTARSHSQRFPELTLRLAFRCLLSWLTSRQCIYKQLNDLIQAVAAVRQNQLVICKHSSPRSRIQVSWNCDSQSLGCFRNPLLVNGAPIEQGSVQFFCKTRAQRSSTHLPVGLSGRCNGCHTKQRHSDPVRQQKSAA